MEGLFALRRGEGHRIKRLWLIDQISCEIVGEEPQFRVWWNHFFILVILMVLTYRKIEVV